MLLPNIVIEGDKLLTNADYCKIIRDIEKKEDILMIKKVMMIVDINRELRSSQPHLKELCDLIDVAVVEGDMYNEYEKFTQMLTFWNKPFPMAPFGKELERDSEVADMPEEEDYPKVDKKNLFDLDGHLLNKTCGFGPLEHFPEPCHFCKELKLANPFIDVHCSNNPVLDQHIYECTFQLPPEIKTYGRWSFETVQCHSLWNYFDRVNHIFLMPNLFRATMLLVSLDNDILPMFPDMRQYIVLMEAIMLKGIYMMDKKFFGTPKKLSRALDSIKFFDEKEYDVDTESLPTIKEEGEENLYYSDISEESGEESSS
jgi:hypothetical protein